MALRGVKKQIFEQIAEWKFEGGRYTAVTLATAEKVFGECAAAIAFKRCEWGREKNCFYADGERKIDFFYESGVETLFQCYEAVCRFEMLEDLQADTKIVKFRDVRHCGSVARMF